MPGGVASPGMTDEPGSVADLIRTAAEAVIDYRAGLPHRPVAGPADRAALLAALGGPLPVAGLGLVMATGAAIASSSVLAGASAALLVHGLGTLPGSSDGNRIWNL